MGFFTVSEADQAANDAFAEKYNIADAIQAFQDGGFGGADGNTWVPGLNTDSYATQSYMDDEQSYTPPPTSYPSNSDMQSYMDDSQSYNPSSLFDQNAQINPAGTSSPDGMMTMPTNYLYPGEAIGIDGVPYRPNAGASTASSGGGGGGASSYSAPQAAAYLSQDLSQRTPSGTQYAPDMSAYNDSSLFNYTGPGGVDGYTYGQGLRTDGADYSVFGTPTDMVNPYYEGQFSDPVPTGPADSAVNMSPIVMPEGIPAIGGGSGTTTANPLDQGKYMGNPNHYNSGQDLSYKQTIDEMGIFGPNNPPPSTLFPSPGGASTPANMGLTERQIAQMSPQQQAYMTQTLADQNRMQQGQLGSGTAPAMNDTSGNYGLTMPDMGNNYGVGERFGSNSIFTGEGQDFYDTVNSGEFEAQQNFNRPTVPGLESVYDNNFDLGRPGDPSYQEFVADPSRFTTNQITDQGPGAQAMADQMMAGLTKEELRDGLFIEPNVSTGKMGIPDIFTQDKTPIEARDASLFDSGFEFDPDNIYAEQGMTDGFLWQDNNGNYHKQWDDMGLIDVIPGMNDPEFLRGEALTESRNKNLAAEQAKQDKIAADANQARAEQAQREQEIYAREQMAAREEVVQRNIAEARAQAEEQARVAADRKAFQDRMAANRKDAARVPVYTAPKAAPTPAPRPTAPAGGYSTKSLNNNFSTRRDVRNLFA